MADRPGRHVDYALIGGGLAAGNCARWLRESGADGAILLIGREPDLPYNRPPSSKGYLRGKESRAETLFRPPEWYREQNIEAARIILDNVHHYGGEESMVRWARLVLVGSQPIRRAA